MQTRILILSILALVFSTVSIAEAGGTVPQGLTLTYRCRTDPLVSMTLVYDPSPTDVQISIGPDSTVVLPQVIGARWEDGLTWYFGDASPDSAGAMLLHGIQTAAGPTSAYIPPQTWVPLEAEQEQIGHSWTWTGLGLEDLANSTEYTEFSVDYRIDEAKPVTVPFGTVDAFKVVLGGTTNKTSAFCVPLGGDEELRWFTTINSFRNAWCVMVRDKVWELVSVEDVNGPIVSTRTSSFGALKSRFR